MATKPKVQTLTNSSVDVLNAIRNSATQNYKDYVPVASSDSDSIKAIGNVIMDYPALQNEFLNTLVNRIGKVILSSKLYENPWTMFKKGVLDFGETIEEIFINIAKPFEFDPDTAEKEVFKREIPNVKSAFHVMNYTKFYKATVSQDQLRTAFLSWDGVTDLVNKIIESMYTGANYDEFQTMKYLLARHILDGKLNVKEIPLIEQSNMSDIVSTIKASSNDLTFMSTSYNLAGVSTFTPKNEQYILMNTKFDAQMDVNVLASAFNMEKADFIGQRVLVDGFGKLDIARLNILFKDNPSYIEIGESDLQALNEIPCIIVDKDYFMIFDNYINMTEQMNSQGLYWNYFLHIWKTFSISPFANNVLFIPQTPSVTSVTVSPETATVTVGQAIQLNAVVQTTAFAPQSVNWSVESGENVTVNSRGLVDIKEGATGEITIKATSTYNSEVSGTATLTVE